MRGFRRSFVTHFYAGCCLRKMRCMVTLRESSNVTRAVAICCRTRRSSRAANRPATHRRRGTSQSTLHCHISLPRSTTVLFRYCCHRKSPPCCFVLLALPLLFCQLARGQGTISNREMSGPSASRGNANITALVTAAATVVRRNFWSSITAGTVVAEEVGNDVIVISAAFSTSNASAPANPTA